MLNTNGIAKWNKLKVGLVLSGGGAKGAFEAGVIQALHDLDIADKVCAVSGTSVGALNTLLFAMDDRNLGKELWEEVRFGTVLTKRKNEDEPTFREIFSGLKSDKMDFQDFVGAIEQKAKADPSFYTQEGLEKLLNEKIDIGKIRKFNGELYVCVYDVDALKPEYLRLKNLKDEDIIKAALASAAIPYVYEPVELNGKRYADGGVNDPAYKVKNADVTPLLPIIDAVLDAIIVVHLKSENDSVKIMGSRTRIINIYPSEPLEPLKGTGTLNFAQSSIREKLLLGYDDALETLLPFLMEHLKK